jgi:predicted polyphosphate/ATP-dependent NAD kinase
LSPTLIGQLGPNGTSADDTRRLAAALAGLDLDLILFAGGDGTARDVQAAIGASALALGVPTGVKMHSAVYATSPRAAGELAARTLGNKLIGAREAEVMDIDEEAFRAGRVSARLYGYLRVPQARGLMQNLKSGGQSDEAELAGLAAEIAERMGDGALWIVGPGTTTRAIATRLDLPKTLLGVDLYCRSEVIALDACEAEILAHARRVPAWIVVTPIGGQGYIFGRGNQQLSADVIRAVGKERIVIAAAMAKLASLRGAPLLAETGDPDLDRELSGHARVVTGYRAETVQRIAPA